MIGRLRGEVIERTANRVLVDVMGVGYTVTVTPQCPFRLGEKVDIHIHTQVREDAINLFGFADPMEREVFDMLISVPNIGPVKAMGILQTPVVTLVQMVSGRETGKLSKLPGVGKKTAERILVDLADKLTGLAPGLVPATSSSIPAPSPVSGVAADLVSALVNLGFKPASAEEVARKAVERLGEKAGLEALLRDALSKGKPG